MPIPLPPLVDVPFQHRHTCWFCAEPSKHQFSYIASSHCSHPSLTVPACKECLSFAKKTPLTSIWQCHIAVKDALMHRYASHLAIGVNWTEQELADSEFSCRILEGFKESGWMMYNIAKDRVNAAPWPLTLEGVTLESESSEDKFNFDGVAYNSINQAINHYCTTLGLDRAFLHAIVSLVGKGRFSYAVRIARINIASHKRVKQQVLSDLAEELD